MNRVVRKLKCTDAELVKAACDGDVNSFRQLFERHYRSAVAIARGRLPDQHLAEDAAQEAFAIACRSLATLKDPSRFSAWLSVICRRTASRMVRSHRINQPLTVEIASPVVDQDANPEVHEALMRLPLTERELVQLHYFAGLTYDEIAAVLGTTVPAVHGRLQRARRTLAKWLVKQKDEVDP